MDEDDVVVSAVATAATLGAGLIAKKLLGAAWAKRRGVVPGDADADVSWREAAAFAVISGAVVGSARLIAQRATVKALAGHGTKQPGDVTAPTA